MVELSLAGRFAPSPTGDLHFGSLLAAMASYCEARSKGALWHLRIDDIDGPRSVAGSALRIQESLQRYGLSWDDEVHWQSKHYERYRNALYQLIEQGLIFRCSCSRRSLPSGKPYPGTCRANLLRTADEPVEDCALRLIAPASLSFHDAVQGRQNINLAATMGDVIVWRRDKLVSYTLACALDDATDVTEVVRGADLLPSTAAQIAIMDYLLLPKPDYAHIPVAVDANNDKLSKHSQAASIDSMNTLNTLRRAWRFLSQPANDAQSIADFWHVAVETWQMQRIPSLLRHSVPIGTGNIQ